MTPYEIIDARLTMSGQMVQTFRWWVSITFAILVAAHAAGPSLVGIPCALVVLLYTLVSFNVLITQNAFVSGGRALNDEARAFQAESESPSPLMEAMLQTESRRSVVILTQLAIRIIMFLATIGYILHRAGYIG